MKSDLFSIFGIAHLNWNVLRCQRRERWSKPTVQAVCVLACWDTSSHSALFVFGLKLPQDLRPRLEMSLLSWVPWDVLQPCSSLTPEEAWEGGTRSGQITPVMIPASPQHYPRWPHPDSKPLGSSSIQCEGQRAEKKHTATAWSKSSSTFMSALEIWALLMLFST